MAPAVVCSPSFPDLAIPRGHSFVGTPTPSTLFLPSLLHGGALGGDQWLTSVRRLPLYLTHLSAPPTRLCAELRWS